ncbi:MAG TPA: response regulator [Mariprofundaceae bacterium]|nr:response regulator [Mariprofundaceae bacterium]
MSADSVVLSSSYDALKRSVQLSIPFGLVIGLTDLIFGRYFIGAADLLTVSGLGTAYLLANRGFDELRLRHLLVFLAAFVFLAALLDGGLAGAGFVWSIGFPTVACFLAGARSGLVWSAVYALITALTLWATQDSDMAMHYAFQPLMYALVAYGMFTGFAYFMASSRERREALLLQTRNNLQKHVDQLAESKENYSAVLATTPNAIGVHCDGKWVYANPSAVLLFGAESENDILGDAAIDYVYKDYRPMVMERMEQVKRGKRAPMVEEKLVRKNGDVFEAEVQASPIVFEGKPAVLTISKDITEQKRKEQEMALLQTQLEHAQRLESLGVMAGGIAHDFNNLLAAIMGNAELAELELEASSKAGKYLANVDAACEKAASLCKQLLAYAGKGEFLIKTIDLGDYLQGMGDLLRASLGKNVRLHVDIEPGLPPVLVDNAQFQQVILNFIVNASDAIGEGQGDIWLAASLVQMNRDTLYKYMNGAAMPEGPYVAVSVRDSGSGMDMNTLGKIFDPFFTTKKTGNGLGLSAILGIIQRHDGGIKVDSEPGKGSEFTVLIPLGGRRKVTKEITTLDAIDMKGSGVVLLVDDEKSIRHLVGKMLMKIGFEVVCAENGVHGMEMFRTHQKDLVLVLLDMTMPRMGGVDAMRAMREINPNIPILLVSGYSEQETHDLPESERPDGFVQKPFRFNALKKALLGVMQKS